MKLEEYLKAIKECPDEKVTLDGRACHKLTLQYGIYDNFQIHTKADYDKVVEDFRKNPNWRQRGKSKHDDGTLNNTFNYVPGTIMIQIQNSVPDYREIYPEILPEFFNMRFLLHPYQERKIERLSEFKALAIAVSEISNYLRVNNFPIFFPESKGPTKKHGSLQRVYWPDKLHDEIQKLRGKKGTKIEII